MARRASSPRPILCAVLDGGALGPDPHALATGLFGAGVDWIQLRDRALEGEPLLRLALELVRARQAVAARGAASPRVIVNRRIDVALAAGADGVHLGFDALAPGEAARLLPDEAWLGASLHSVAEVASAAGSPLGYAHLAPIWDPLSKPASRPALGPAVLAQAARSGLPILAQGGLTAERATHAIEAGAAGIAVTGVLDRHEDPIEAVGPLREALDRAQRAPTRERVAHGTIGEST